MAWPKDSHVENNVNTIDINVGLKCDGSTHAINLPRITVPFWSHSIY